MAVNTANLRGGWAIGTAYALYDVVDYDGYKYECVNASGSTGNEPAGDTAGTYWTLIASDGAIPDPTGKNAVILNEATYSAAFGDVIFALATTTISLPVPIPEGDNGCIIVISNGASITATVQPASTAATVNGTTSVTVTTQYTRKTFYTDGFNWFAA